uniref:TNFR-Cys domain-containing protein n=1 Tax=Xiphophorus couchianus TaxID=32473 RepID=A0A3B5KZ97_9TELE
GATCEQAMPVSGSYFSPYMCNLNMFTGAGLKEKQQCVITADTVCEPMEGFYCTDLKSGGCSVAQKHRSCEPGHYISRMGTASTDTECSECSSGSFSDGTMLSCQPHTQCENENLQLIKAGTASTDAECGGKSSNITGIVISVLFLVIFLGTRRTLPRQTNCGLPSLTPILRSFSSSSRGWMVLKALEKSKNVILTVSPPPSRCDSARCSRKI